MADIQEYSVSIKFKTEGSEKASKDAEKVKDSIGKLKGSTKGFDGLKTGLSSVGKFTGKAATALKGFAVVTGAALVKAGKSASKYSKEMMDYIETVNLFRTSMGDLADKAMEFVNRGQFELGLNPKEMMDALSSFQNLSEGFGIASDRAYIMSKNLTQLSGDLSSFANISFDQAQKKLMAGFSGQVMPLRKYGIALDQASLQETAYSLGLDQRVKTMTRAQKSELIYYQIMKSTQKMQGDLGRTLMSPANALRVMQNEFKSLARAVGSIFIPVIQTVIPYVRALTKVLTQAAQAIASFFGFNIKNYTADLSGLSDGFGDIGGDIEDVGDAAEGTAKKMNKMLMPFDELNNISSNQGSGSGAGAGGGIGGGSLGIELPEYDMFEFIDDRVPKFGDILEKFRETAHKINDLLRGIDWESIKETASEWGTNLGEFINVGVSEFDWRLIGESIAQGLNTVLTFVANFLETTDFEELGRAVNNLIQGFFENIEWDKVGRILSEGLTGALDVWLSVMANFDPGKVLEAVWEVLSNVDWGKLLSRLWSVFGVLLKNSPIVLMAKGIAKLYDLVINYIIEKLNGISFDLPDWLGGGHFGFDIETVDSTKQIDDFIDRAFLLEKYTEDVYQDTSDSMKETTVKTWDEIEDKTFKGIDNVNEKIAKEGGAGFYDWALNSSNEYEKGLSIGLKGIIGFDKIKEIAKEKLDLENEAKDWGNNTTNGYNNGLNSKISFITGAFDKIKVAAQENMNLTNQSNEWGSSTINNYNLGVETEENNTFNLFKKLNTMIQEKLNQATEAQQAGENTMNSYNQGINNTQSGTSRLLERLQSSIRTAFDNAQVARAEAEATGAGYTSGLENKIRAEAIKNSVKGDIKRMFASYNESYSWGTDMARGLRDGIDANKELVISKLREMANSVRRLLHFSRPDEGPLRDYETWMPDMIKGLSDSLIQAAPMLDNAVNQIADKMAESLSNIEMPDVEQSLFVNQNSSQLIRNIGNKTNNSTDDNVTGNMIRATYEAVSRALVDNKGTKDNRQIIVNVGNKELYRGYGQYQDEESNMLGITV